MVAGRTGDAAGTELGSARQRSVIDEAESILDEAERVGLRPALLGGLAVRAWAGALPRETLDVDLHLPDAAGVAEFGRLLAHRGYRVLDDPGWRRAVRAGPDDRVVVDWTGPDVPDPRTRLTYRLHHPPTRRKLRTRVVPVVALPDLIVLKLLAGRDQDVADLLLLATLPERPSATTLLECGQSALADGRLESQTLRVCTSVHAGNAAQVVSAVLGRNLEPSALAPLDRLVCELLEELRR
ncbi:MAG: nucleotidyl transferase AbiEii/AbiGii toxin family protein [Deltaproteobacteria bacterium]|nr:nucleotidyl transferase AbiEii/AbiGii toxin family protein [Deltaproteobacteria bacterium]